MATSPELALAFAQRRLRVILFYLARWLIRVLPRQEGCRIKGLLPSKVGGGCAMARHQTQIGALPPAPSLEIAALLCGTALAEPFPRVRAPHRSPLSYGPAGFEATVAHRGVGANWVEVRRLRKPTIFAVKWLGIPAVYAEAHIWPDG